MSAGTPGAYSFSQILSTTLPRSSLESRYGGSSLHGGRPRNAFDHAGGQEKLAVLRGVRGDAPQLVEIAPPHLGVPSLQPLLVRDGIRLHLLDVRRAALAGVQVEQLLPGLAVEHAGELVGQV